MGRPKSWSSGRKVKGRKEGLETFSPRVCGTGRQKTTRRTMAGHDAGKISALGVTQAQSQALVSRLRDDATIRH